MKVLKNTQKKQIFVQQKNKTINAYITVPFAGAHRSTRLTIKSGDVRLDLDGRQVKTLRYVLDRSRALTDRPTPRTKRVAKSRTTTSR